MSRSRTVLIHVDLKRIAMDKMMKVEVPIILEGVPSGVKTEGGVLELVLREVEIECLPGDIPSSIIVDVSNLAFEREHPRGRPAARWQVQVHFGRR